MNNKLIIVCNIFLHYYYLLLLSFSTSTYSLKAIEKRPMIVSSYFFLPKAFN